MSKKNEGMRFDAGKMNIHLIPAELIVELARVYSVGALKYAPRNWEKGMDWSKVIDSADRHYTKWLAGLVVDPETGCHHLAHAIWNLTALLVYQMRGIGNDDRTMLPLSEDFQWTEGPAASMGLGLPQEKLKELADKYRQLREAVA